MIGARHLRLNPFIGFPGNFRGLYTVVIHMNHFFIRHLNVQAAQQIHYIRKRQKVHTDIILDIQIQIPVQHIHGFLRSSLGISHICLIIMLSFLSKHRVPVNRNQFYFFCLIIETGHNDCIASGRSAVFSAFSSAVGSKQRDIGIPFLGPAAGVDVQHCMIHLFKLKDRIGCHT